MTPTNNGLPEGQSRPDWLPNSWQEGKGFPDNAYLLPSMLHDYPNRIMLFLTAPGTPVEILPLGYRDRLRELEAALSGLVEKLSPMMEAREYKPISRDHACSDCLEGYSPEFRELVIPGFQCAWHRARSLSPTTMAPAKKDEEQ
jgi:hypothetical protein